MDKHKQNEVTRMRFSPIKLLQGLLCTTPILVLALAACGGGGSSTTSAPVVATYTVGGAASGVSATSSTTGLVLRNNGGDDLNVASGVTSYTFPTAIVAGASYNVTVLKNPSSPIQKCTVAAASGVMPTSNVTNANVTCVPGFTISASVTNDTSTGLVLQNNGGDNLLIPASGLNVTQTVAFSTPLADLASYTVTVLTQPNTPVRLICTPTSTTGTVSGANVTVSISCTTDPSPLPDRFAYTANFSDNTLSAYAITATSGGLNASQTPSTGSGPSSVAADAASHVYATNQSANTISAFSITATNGGLTPLSDVDGGTAGYQSSIPTGPAPVAIVIHPSGKFAYVVNSGSGSAADANSVSAYSIDATSGALARIDTNGTIGGTQYFIPTRVTPVSIAIDPAGAHAYVTNFGSGNITVYSIDATSGALAEIQTTNTNTVSDPYSIAIDPAGAYAYVTSWNTNFVYSFLINADGTLPSSFLTAATGTGPRAVTIDPTGKFAYVVNSSSNNVSAYTIKTGALTPTVPATFSAGANPISIAIDSSGQYAYVANYGDHSVSMYSLDATTGNLTSLGTTSTGVQPSSVITVR